MRNQVERTAEKWYIQLKKTSYKYIAIYKERLDSLYSYQKELHEIIEFHREKHLYPDTVIRAIHELPLANLVEGNASILFYYQILYPTQNSNNKSGKWLPYKLDVR
jgi:hypothetical protein